LRSPTPLPDQALVRVRDDVAEPRRGPRPARASRPEPSPAWDVAGVVERAAADGSGPPRGARVSSGCSGPERGRSSAAVPTSALAALPDAIADAQAAALPTAGADGAALARAWRPAALAGACS
jgi:NADPH:quinone reductase-like Zn-dependent oxidoreductase